MTNHTKPSGALRSLRARNRSLVIDVLRHEGSASRAEIARRTGLSRATISSLVADLQREGLVVEGRTGPAQPGAQGGRPGSTGEMLAGSAVGNVACHRVMADAGRAIGRALADLVTCLNPSLIVVGCHPDAAAEPLLNGIREAIGRYALPAAVQAVSVAARSRRGARRAARSPGPRDFPNHQPTNHDGMTTVKEEEL